MSEIQLTTPETVIQVQAKPVEPAKSMKGKYDMRRFNGAHLKKSVRLARKRIEDNPAIQPKEENTLTKRIVKKVKAPSKR